MQKSPSKGGSQGKKEYLLDAPIEVITPEAREVAAELLAEYEMTYAQYLKLCVFELLFKSHERLFDRLQELKSLEKHQGIVEVRQRKIVNGGMSVKGKTVKVWR